MTTRTNTIALYVAMLFIILSLANYGQAADKPAEDKAGLPEIPYVHSEVVKGIGWLGESLKGQGFGDVWTCAWADDDNIYSVADDCSTDKGPRAFAIFKITDVPPKHAVSMVNDMGAYSSKFSPWKGAGLTCIDGVLYLGLYWQTGPGKGSPTKTSWNAANSSIIKSVDHGQTWTPTASKGKPMFPGKQFPTPFFVQYGKDYSGAMDDFIYIVSNDGGWNNWDRMILARVPRTKMPALNRADWAFFAGADTTNNPTWSADVSEAAAIFEHKGFTGMTGIQYVPAIKRFVMGQWSYVQPWQQTMLCLYEAPKPWGPWRLIHAQTPWGPAYYNPCFPVKWFTDGGLKMWMVEGGDWKGPDRKVSYRFRVRQLELLLQSDQ